MSAMQDMTKGGAAGHLLRYAVPLMLGNWFQLAYNAVDSIIAGRFIGKDALAAEGIAGPVMNLVILGITGVCLGAGVLMSEFFGAKDGESLRRELATTVLSGTAACTVVALLGVLFTPAILQACAVPREIFAITAIYLRITFLGAPFTCFYNALAAGFKSVGDARTPLRFLMVSAILTFSVCQHFFSFFSKCFLCCFVLTGQQRDLIISFLICQHLNCIFLTNFLRISQNLLRYYPVFFGIVMLVAIIHSISGCFPPFFDPFFNPDT